MGQVGDERGTQFQELAVTTATKVAQRRERLRDLDLQDAAAGEGEGAAGGRIVAKIAAALMGAATKVGIFRRGPDDA